MIEDKLDGNMMIKTISDDDGSDHEGSCSDGDSKISPEVFDGGDDDDDGTNEERLAKSRERNREHARRTRLRKKSQLQDLQYKAKDLEAERKILKQSIEECNIASILLNLSGNGLGDEETKGITTALMTDEASGDAVAIAKKRKRLASDASDLVITIDGKQTTIRGNGKTHVNWKTGVYTDEAGTQQALSSQELEALR
jgi:hypothetical protein